MAEFSQEPDIQCESSSRRFGDSTQLARIKEGIVGKRRVSRNLGHKAMEIQESPPRETVKGHRRCA